MKLFWAVLETTASVDTVQIVVTDSFLACCSCSIDCRRRHWPPKVRKSGRPNVIHIGDSTGTASRVRSRKNYRSLRAREGKSLHNPIGKRATVYAKGLMRRTQDFGRRKVYGLVRVSLAMTRLSKAETKTEKEKAGEWLWAWVAFGGVRRFKADRNLDKEGGDRRLISSN
jgi:hypothetical protein